MTALARAAGAYASRGWPVFPLEARGKRPLQAGGFHTASTDPAQVAAWWARRPEANIGFRPAGAGLLVIDVDGPTGELTAQRLGLLAEPTLEVVTGRAEGGRHRYYRHPDGTIGNVTLGEKLDVRADHGYVILPPSVHPTGARYRWAGSIDEIAELPPSVVDRLRRRAEPIAAALPIPLPPASGNLERRITAYLASVGSCGEGSRNNAAFQVAAWLTRDLALTTESAWPWLASWNASNAPPLAESELAGVLASATRTGRRPVGCGVERAAFGRQTVGCDDSSRWAPRW